MKPGGADSAVAVGTVPVGRGRRGPVVRGVGAKVIIMFWPLKEHRQAGKSDQLSLHLLHAISFFNNLLISTVAIS